MKEKGWYIKVYGENALFIRMHWHKYYEYARQHDCILYNYSIYRMESYHKFLYEEKLKYDNERRKIYEDDLY